MQYGSNVKYKNYLFLVSRLRELVHGIFRTLLVLRHQLFEEGSGRVRLVAVVVVVALLAALIVDHVRSFRLSQSCKLKVDNVYLSELNLNVVL